MLATHPVATAWRDLFATHPEPSTSRPSRRSDTGRIGNAVGPVWIHAQVGHSMLLSEITGGQALGTLCKTTEVSQAPSILLSDTRTFGRVFGAVGSRHCGGSTWSADHLNHGHHHDDEERNDEHEQP